MSKNKDLSWTGERLTTVKNDETVTEHLHRYALALDLCKGKNVLDIASGEGYGAHLLSKVAANVIGVDISKEAIDHASAKYKASNLSYLVGSADSIPIPDHSLDVVVSFETLEHHDKHTEMLLEVKRVLRPGGLLFMSSPDKLNYSDNIKRKNEFHVKELYREEFKALIHKHFSNCEIYYQSIFYGSIILPENGLGKDFKEYSGTFDAIESSSILRTPLYNICIASDSELTLPTSFSFFDASEFMEALKARDREIYASKTYRLGHFFTFPIRMLRKLFK